MAEFVCPYCEKVFAKGFRYREHVRLKHSGLQYVCSLCSSEFSTPTNRNQHERVVHGPTGTRPMTMGGSAAAYCSNFEIGRFECRECTVTYPMDKEGCAKMDVHVSEHANGLKELIGRPRDI